MSSNKAPVPFIRSTVLPEPVYSKILPCTFSSLWNALTIKSPLSTKFPELFFSAVKHTNQPLNWYRFCYDHQKNGTCTFPSTCFAHRVIPSVAFSGGTYKEMLCYLSSKTDRSTHVLQVCLKSKIQSVLLQAFVAHTQCNQLQASSPTI